MTNKKKREWWWWCVVVGLIMSEVLLIYFSTLMGPRENRATKREIIINTWNVAHCCENEANNGLFCRGKIFSMISDCIGLIKKAIR